MRNNFKIILVKNLIIIFFLISTANTIEQFNFDITEIELTDNGNQFKGLKRGSATSDNGLIIEADIFEYNKLTNILSLQTILHTLKIKRLSSHKVTLKQ